MRIAVLFGGTSEERDVEIEVVEPVANDRELGWTLSAVTLPDTGNGVLTTRTGAEPLCASPRLRLTTLRIPTASASAAITTTVLERSIRTPSLCVRDRRSATSAADEAFSASKHLVAGQGHVVKPSA